MQFSADTHRLGLGSRRTGVVFFCNIYTKMKSLPKNHTRYVVFDDIHDNTKLSGAMSNVIRKFGLHIKQCLSVSS